MMDQEQNRPLQQSNKERVAPLHLFCFADI